ARGRSSRAPIAGARASVARRAQLVIGRGPGLLEPRVDLGGLLLLALGLEGLTQAEQAEPVLRQLLEILAVDLLGVLGPLGLEVDRAERVADRVVPVGRLVVVEGELELEGLLEVRDRGLPLLALG